MFGITAFSEHYFCNINVGANDNILLYAVRLAFFVTFSGVCTAELVKIFFRCGMVKYMLISSLVSLIEVAPLPFCRQYFTMGNNYATKSYFLKSFVYSANIILFVLLLTAMIYFFRKKYRIEICSEKNPESETAICIRLIKRDFNRSPKT